MINPGTLIHERYRVARAVGRGGMGAVYEAADERLRAPVALKQMALQGEQAAAAFEREAQILAGLRHPALPRVIDHFLAEEGQFLVMEFIPGDDLAAALAARGGDPFPPAAVLAWADQLLDALEYLHGRTPPVVHRDIKPQNIKLGPRGEPILLDFGLAKGTAALSQAGEAASVFGYTPQYAPPEQAQGSGTDARADLYSLGATLYQLLTARPPAPALERLAAAFDGRPDPLVPAHELRPGLHPVLSAALSRALALRPAERFPDAQAMRAALREAQGAIEAAAGGQTRTEPPREMAQPAGPVIAPRERYAPEPRPAEGTTVAPPASPELSDRPRRPALPLLAGLVALLLLCGGGAVALLLRPGPGGAASAPSPPAAATLAPAAPSADPREQAATPAALDPGIEQGPAAPTPPPVAGLNLTNNPGRSEEPVALAGPDGRLHLIWADTTPSGGAREDLVYRSRGPDGAWDEQVTNLSEGFETYFGPHSLLQRPDGAVCAIWAAARVSTNPETLGPYMRCLEGGAWGEAEQLGRAYNDIQPAFAPDGTVHFLSIQAPGTLLFDFTTELGDGFAAAYGPALAVDAGGTLHAVWARQAEPYTVAHRHSHDGGATWSEPAQLDPGDASVPGAITLAPDADGGVHLLWSDGGDVFHRRWFDGAWGEIASITDGANRNSSTGLGLAIGPGGRAQALWQGLDLRLARQAADGSWGEPRMLSADDPGGSPPALAVDDQGRAHVIWETADDLFYALVEWSE